MGQTAPEKSADFINLKFASQAEGGTRWASSIQPQTRGQKANLRPDRKRRTDRVASGAGS